MTVTTRYFKPESTNKKNEEGQLTTLWQNCRIVRQHSMRAAMREILDMAKSTGAVQVNLVGLPGMGKTTFSLSAAHLLHQLSDVPYVVKRWGRAELLDIENQIKKLVGANYIMIFDDISWLEANATKTQIDQIIKTMTEIRHLQEGDFRIISFFNFHYSYAIKKAMRNSTYWFYFSIGSSEFENVAKLVGKNNIERIKNFRRVVSEAQGDKKIFRYFIGKHTHHYQYRAPMAPCLFWNGSRLRDIVFPSREWINPICDVCRVGSSMDKTSEEELEDFAQAVLKKYGSEVIRTALRIKLMMSWGINTWNPHVVQVGRFIDDYMKHKPLAPEALAKRFNLEETKTTTHYKIPPEIANTYTKSDLVAKEVIDQEVFKEVAAPTLD